MTWLLMDAPLGCLVMLFMGSMFSCGWFFSWLYFRHDNPPTLPVQELEIAEFPEVVGDEYRYMIRGGGVLIGYLSEKISEVENE